MKLRTQQLLQEPKRFLLQLREVRTHLPHVGRVFKYPFFYASCKQLHRRHINESRLSFWSALDQHVAAKGAIRPVKLFDTVCRLSKFEERRVEYSAQSRSEMNSSSAAPGWEQDFIIFFPITLLVNSYTSWRLTSNDHHLNRKETFGSLDRFKPRVNQFFIVFADYTSDIA